MVVGGGGLAVESLDVGERGRAQRVGQVDGDGDEDEGVREDEQEGGREEAHVLRRQEQGFLHQSDAW